jgi:hypothetical protein
MQIIAFIDEELAEKAQRLRKLMNITLQEFIAEAINASADFYGRPPLLKVSRVRIINRKRSVAKASDSEKIAKSRNGKIRLAGWYEKRDVERVARLKGEMGINIERLVEQGIHLLLTKASN